MTNEIFLCLIILAFGYCRRPETCYQYMTKSEMVGVTYRVLYFQRKFRFCWNLPPRCSYLAPVYKDQTAYEEKNVTEKIEICCEGYHEVAVTNRGLTCAPVCHPECNPPNWSCVEPNVCSSCVPGQNGCEGNNFHSVEEPTDYGIPETIRDSNNILTGKSDDKNSFPCLNISTANPNKKSTEPENVTNLKPMSTTKEPTGSRKQMFLLQITSDIVLENMSAQTNTDIDQEIASQETITDIDQEISTQETITDIDQEISIQEAITGIDQEMSTEEAITDIDQEISTQEAITDIDQEISIEEAITGIAQEMSTQTNAVIDLENRIHTRRSNSKTNSSNFSTNFNGIETSHIILTIFLFFISVSLVVCISMSCIRLCLPQNFQINSNTDAQRRFTESDKAQVFPAEADEPKLKVREEQLIEGMDDILDHLERYSSDPGSCCSHCQCSSEKSPPAATAGYQSRTIQLPLHVEYRNRGGSLYCSLGNLEYLNLTPQETDYIRF